MTEFFVPTGPGESEYDEKRSRFLGHVRPVESEEEARSFIAAIKKEHYDARHNCWCYIIKDGPERYSDDGEPQGTAGIPMLEVFRREGVPNVVCVVTRYFGGILLGAGGLLRAYTRAASEALCAAGISVTRRWIVCTVDCPYSASDRLRNEIVSAGGIIDRTDYGASVVFSVLIPEENQDSFSALITEASAGTVSALAAGEALKAVPVK